jgi:hypothetical protein
MWRKPLRSLVSLSLLTAIVLTLYLAVFRGQPRVLPQDPRLNYAGPFRNVHPAVRYVSEERCADCHLDKALTYAEHPMGRSLVPVAKAAALPEDARHHNPFQAFGSLFLIERRGNQVLHRRIRLDPAGQPAAVDVQAVHYVVGSGTRGHSYLSERDGYVFQTPISWYAQKESWDLAPGFGVSLLTGRAILPECLFCHANRANYVEGSVNRYTQPVFEGHAIGCQRCHGPGELHVARRERGEQEGNKPDDTIVNPRHLEPALRDAVCEQCHLSGEMRVVRHGRGLYDFRPGLPLEAFWSVFVDAPETGKAQKAVSHVEQLYQSRCFQAGKGPDRLGCVTCHDPHQRVPSAERVAHYRSRCLHCHERQGCRLPAAERLRQSPADSCIACHMPRYGSSDIPHTASTDHRILRGAKAPAPGSSPGLPASALLPMVSFYRAHPGNTAADERDRAIALIKLALTGESAAATSVGQTLPVLDAALRHEPDDWIAGEARGHALGLQRRWAEALLAFQDVLTRAPGRELALVGAAAAAEASGQENAARQYWQRAVAANPWAPDYRRRLVRLLVKQEAWEQAQPDCQAWVRLDPLSEEARMVRVQCLLATGNKDEARAEFARLEALAPPNLPELRLRFAKKLK